MPRKPREECPGAVHHVYARGNRKQRIFLCDEDRVLYLALLGEVVCRMRWRCMSYCLMANHVHVLVETPDPNLGVGMQRLHGMYAQTFNRRHRHSGHVFQGRYGAVRMTTDEQLLTAARYIVRNPVEAGLCQRPGDWRWSSHAATIDGRRPAWLDSKGLLAYFGAAGGEPRERYEDFVR
jgi:putative transposase